jgi:hypothetical protein
MDRHRDDTLITALIETVAMWSDTDRHRLAAMLGSHCWPGGILDRREPRSVESLRDWRPGGPVPALPACTCARGRCAVCN